MCNKKQTPAPFARGGRFPFGSFVWAPPPVASSDLPEKPGPLSFFAAYNDRVPTIHISNVFERAMRGARGGGQAALDLRSQPLEKLKERALDLTALWAPEFQRLVSDTAVQWLRGPSVPWGWAAVGAPPQER